MVNSKTVLRDGLGDKEREVWKLEKPYTARDGLGERRVDKSETIYI